MDTVSTFVEDEDDDGAPETYYYSSEGGGENREGRSRQGKGGREQAQLPLGETRTKRDLFSHEITPRENGGRKGRGCHRKGKHPLSTSLLLFVECDIVVEVIYPKALEMESSPLENHSLAKGASTPSGRLATGSVVFNYLT